MAARFFVSQARSGVRRGKPQMAAHERACDQNRTAGVKASGLASGRAGRGEMTAARVSTRRCHDGVLLEARHLLVALTTADRESGRAIIS